MLEADHSYDYDVIIIGAGPGGAEAARKFGENGKKVALIEGNVLGGTCLNRGCIPAKTMLYMAEMYRKLQDMPQYGINIDVSTATFDFKAMIEKRTGIMDKLRRGLAFMLKKHNVEVIEAYATLKDAHTVDLSTESTITASHIILATGGESRRFPGFIEDDPRYLTSDNIFEITDIPKSMTIVGAGPVGTEFATFFKTLGTEINIVEMGSSFMTYYDHKLGDELIKAFKRQDITCHLETSIESIDTSANLLKISLKNGETLESEFILSAIGVNIKTDYCTAAGVELTEKNKVKVNENYQTSLPNIYALGDLIGKSGSAYGAEREAKFIAYHLLGKNTSLVPVNYIAMPDVIFTHPEVGTCGYSNTELEELGVEYDTYSVQFMVNAKAHIKNATRGSIWIYVEKESRKIKGVHIIGEQATELIHMIPPILLNELTVEYYLKMTWGHPVLSEIIKECLELGKK